MAFMAKKKKYRFQVELTLNELNEVPLVSAVLFAKLRLLDGGTFTQYSTREEVKDHKVKWDAQFDFQCKMSANASTGVLEPCTLRVSVRKEVKGGRAFQKLGFSDINLAELAGSGLVSKQYLLEGYDIRNRQDNSMLRITVKMNMLAGDIVFKVPSPTTKLPNTVVPAHDDIKTSMMPDRDKSDDYSVIKMRPIKLDESDVVGVVTLTQSLHSNSNNETTTALSHSRNSSSTSKASTQHSRESSSGESCVACAARQQSPATNTCNCSVVTTSHTTTTLVTSDTASGQYLGLYQRQSSFSCVPTNPSTSSLNLLETGSLDRAKSALERRCRRNEFSDVDSMLSGHVHATLVSDRVEITRPDRYNLIEEIIKSVDIKKGGQSCLDSAGQLQLFIAKDGTAAVGNQEVKSQMGSGVQAFKEVVIDERRSS